MLYIYIAVTIVGVILVKYEVLIVVGKPMLSK